MNTSLSRWTNQPVQRHDALARHCQASPWNKGVNIVWTTKFVAKKPYLDHSLYLVIFKNVTHVNVAREHCHGTMVNRFGYAFGVGLLKEMKIKIAQSIHMSYHMSKLCNNTPNRFETWLFPTYWSRMTTYSCCCQILGTFVIRGRKNFGKNIHLIPLACVWRQLKIMTTCSLTKNTH